LHNGKCNHHQAFLAPVELEGFAQVKLQWDEGLRLFAGAGAPGTDEVGDTGVATGITAGLNLHEQRASRATIVLGPQRTALNHCSSSVMNPLSLLNPAARL